MRNFFYNKIIWHHVAAFADIFNDMQTYIYDVDGNAIGEKRIPVYLAPKEKIVSALQKGNWETDGSLVFENYLPSISIVWTGLNLDTERLAGQRNNRRLYVELEGDENCQSEIIHTDFKSVPYKLQFEVTLWAKYMDDMAQMLENILPFFHPEAYISFYEKSVQTERKIKVEKTSETLNFVYEMNQPDRRVLQSNIMFDLECNFYKPENPITKPIKRMYLNIADVQSPVSAYGDSVIVEASGGSCFADLDTELRSFIKQFELEDEFYSAQFYNETVGLPPQPKELEHPFLTNEEIEAKLDRDPRFNDISGYRFFKATVGQQSYVVYDDDISSNDNIVASVINPYREKPINISDIITSNGYLTLVLSEPPEVAGYDIIWRLA